jgi:hypothetical protein
VEKVCLGDDRLDQGVEGICCSPDDKIVGVILNPDFQEMAYPRGEGAWANASDNNTCRTSFERNKQTRDHRKLGLTGACASAWLELDFVGLQTAYK